MLGLLLFLRFDAVLAIAGVAAGLVLIVLNGGRIPASLAVTAGAAALAAIPYYLGPLRAYIDRPIVFLYGLSSWHYLAIAAAVVGALAALAAARRWAAHVRRAVAFAPVLLSAAVVLGTIYGLFFRRQAGKLAIHDAESLRTFTTLYATLPAVMAAAIGYVTAARQTFWRAPEVFTTVAVFSFFLFYKIRIVPEHFWMSRRFLAVILPGVPDLRVHCRGMGAAADGRPPLAEHGDRRRFRRAAGEPLRPRRPAAGRACRVRRHHSAARAAGRSGWRRRTAARRVARRRVRRARDGAAAGVHLRAERPRAVVAAPRSRRVRAVPRVGARPLQARVVPRRRRHRAAVVALEREERRQPAVPGP